MTESNALHRLVRRVPARVAGAGVLTLALAAGFAGGRVTLTASGPAPTPAQTPVARAVAAAPQVAPSPMSYSPIVDRVTPAVVTVYVEKRAQASETSLPEEFRDFFGQQFGGQFSLPRGNGNGQSRQFRLPQQRESGLGSGVIIRPDGYILTNNHVVDSVDKIRVELSDGRSFSAKVVGTDEASDLAVIKIDATNLPTLAYGDSDRVKVGDVVLAVGNPLGIGQTVTMGIVSAKGRSTERGGGEATAYEDFLQTDAPINRGNSGGALVNMNGELVGINAQILSPSGGNIGLGFAIPSGMAHAVADQLINGGVVHRSKLGVGVQGVTPEIADSLGLKDMRGALVSSVEAGSPAERAGVKVQDVIVGYDGHPVADSNALRNMVASTRPGQAAELKIVRDGRTETLTAHVVERDGDKASATRGNRGRGSEGEGETGYGMTLSPITPQLARQLDVPPSASGVVVTDVDPDSIAANAGVRAGDVIKRVNGREVASVAALRTALNGQSGKPALMLVTRQGADIFVALPSARS